jgi:signal transduction histidine kinase/CheY-like chemotaxis protein
MIRSWKSFPGRVAWIYFVIALAYIILSDWAVELGQGGGWVPGVQTIKGFVFVALSAALIRFLVGRELRRRELLEQQLMRAQRMEAVGQLTSSVAHDFNNFLTVILGNLELIRLDAPPDSPLQKRADNALIATEKGADLSRRLLAFSRKQSLKPRIIDANECLTQMKMLLGSVLGEGIRVETELSRHIAPIKVDPGRLETAILNLALNARDAMPAGGTISLTTQSARFESDQRIGRWAVGKGDYVMISVRDQGSGMTARVQENLLVPFFTTKTAGKGTGLGFSMTHGFVVQSGGYVTVSSAPGDGTSVDLYFPAIGKTETAADTAGPPLDAARGKETILLVDNDIAVRAVLGDMLTQLGYAVVNASRASEASEVVTRVGGVDLMITDVVLGGTRNGIELVNDLRGGHPVFPVLLISGLADPAILEKLSVRTQVDWLAKPFSRLAVARKLRELLDNRG